VTVIARGADALESVRARLGVVTISADVTDETAHRILAEVRPDILALNADATPRMGRLDQLSWAGFTAPWEHDVKAVRRSWRATSSGPPPARSPWSWNRDQIAAAPSSSCAFHTVTWVPGRMDVIQLRQLGQCLLALDGSQGHLRHTWIQTTTPLFTVIGSREATPMSEDATKFRTSHGSPVTRSEIAQLDEVEGRGRLLYAAVTPRRWRRRLPSVWMLRCWRGCAKRPGYSTEVTRTLREEVLSQA
jgi:hypothetical protein